MRIDLTGQVRIEDGESVLDESGLPGRQGRLVFACLALKGEPVQRDVLAEALWPAGPPTTWERTLSGVVSRLRSGFATAGFEGLRIANAFGCYELQRPEGARLDVEIAAGEVEAAVRALSVGDMATASAAATMAASIARRPLLAGEEGDWLDAARTSLRSVLVRALEVQTAAGIGSQDAVASAGEAIELEPFRESAHVLLMRAHAALGNTADALLAYERCRAVLAEELGIDPSPETQVLHVALLQADTDEVLALVAAEGLISLPSTLTSFIGRTAELERVLDLLTSCRLVTLTGPGGVGKTRLAIEVARGLVGSFPDGVHFVDLTAIGMSSSLPEQVASAIGVRMQGEPTAEALAAILDSQKLLLILDNCEHVLGDVDDLIEDVIAKTSGPSILATSRAALEASAEHVFDVPVLECPDEDDDFGSISASESVTLFRDRATSVRPDFALTAANASIVGSICRRLDGVPLAIELAAARIGTMSATEVSERLAERFTSADHAVPRHRTVHAAIDWSYDLLPSREAETFRCVAVCEGAFAIDDASAICARDVGAELVSLRSRSLLRPEENGRFRMLETIKQYARERIEGSAAWDVAVDRHIDHYVQRAERVGRCTDFTVLLEELSTFRADATATIDRALERGRIEDAIRVVAVMWKLWHATGSLMEGRRVLERVLSDARRLGDATPSVLPVVLGLGTIAGNQSDFTTATTTLREAVALAEEAGDIPSRASALASLAFAYLATGRLDEFTNCSADARDAAEASGNSVAAGAIYQYLSGAAFMRADAEEARQYAELSLDRFTRAAHRSGMARALLLLTEIEGPDGIREDWLELRTRALDLARENRDRLTEAVVTGAIGNQLIADGLFEEGLPMVRQAMVRLRRTGERRVLIKCLETVADVEADIGDAARALTLYSAIETLRSELGMPLSEADRVVVDGRLERARSAAGDDADRAAALGANMPFDELYEMALSSSAPASRDVALTQ